ncbi:hypothetical protein OG976_16665 [Mycobacterium sp. NBC_00419]|uniref:hypothetical protein n=1 Tax=Mycobacterium sp. NBC_00419 TaxID=2975989 RepID=UPI002E1C6811
MAEKTSLPSTEPHHAPIFDTGPHPGPLRALGDPVPDLSSPHAFSELDNFDTDAFMQPLSGLVHAEPVVVPPAPAVADSSYLHVRRWQFVFIVAAVWLLAAACGLGFYFWWYTSLHKTPATFGVLLYLIGCAVAGVLVSMVPNRPAVIALAIALMSAPMASVAAAAVLHGAYYFEWVARPAIG